ncbi:MAG: bacterial Ig-like domain-containing protein [Clostridia bacterium]
MKKILSTLLLTLLFIPFSFLFSACGEKAVVGIEIAGNIISTGIIAKNTELTGLQVRFAYEDSTKSEYVEVTADMISGYTKTYAGKQTVTVTYQEKINTFDVIVYDKLITTKAELQSAQTQQTDNEVWAINGTIGSTEDYIITKLSKKVQIYGTKNATVYGTFFVGSDNVIIDGINLFVRGGGGDFLKNGMNLVCKIVTIKNCKFTLPNPTALALTGGVGNGIVIWPYGTANANIQIVKNTFIGFNAVVAEWCSSAIVTAENLAMDRFGKTGESSVTLGLTQQQEVAFGSENTFNGCTINYGRQNWAVGSDSIITILGEETVEVSGTVFDKNCKFVSQNVMAGLKEKSEALFTNYYNKENTSSDKKSRQTVEVTDQEFYIEVTKNLIMNQNSSVLKINNIIVNNNITGFSTGNNRFFDKKPYFIKDQKLYIAVPVLSVEAINGKVICNLDNQDFTVYAFPAGDNQLQLSNVSAVAPGDHTGTAGKTFANNVYTINHTKSHGDVYILFTYKVGENTSVASGTHVFTKKVKQSGTSYGMDVTGTNGTTFYYPTAYNTEIYTGITEINYTVNIVGLGTVHMLVKVSPVA